MKHIRVLACLTVIGLSCVPAGAEAAPQPETLAYMSNGGISISSPAGAPGVQVVRQGYQPALSPDGTRLAWVALTSDRHPHVFVGPVSGGPAVQVTGGPATDQSPAWSPDGSTIALSRFAGDGVEHLALVDADGSNGHLLDTRGSAPTWSPDGRLLAFRTASGIATVDTSGRGADVLSTDRGLPSWSPDGSRLALADDDVRLLDVASRRSTLILTGNGSTLPSTLYEAVTFNAAGDRVYARHVEIRDKMEFTDDVRRYMLDGQPDTTFSPVPQSLGYGYAGTRLISVGGGERPAAVRTTPTSPSQLEATGAVSRVRLTWLAPPASAQFAGFSVRYAPGSSPPATVTDGVPAADTMGSSLTVGRLAPSTAYSFSVFTRDWSGAASPAITATVTTPADVATTLSMTGSGTITYGQASALSGRLIREDNGAPIAGATLTLLGHHTGQRDSTLGTLTTDSDGRFSTRRLTSEATRYSVRYAGSAPLLPAVGSTLVLVRQRITITFSPTSHPPAYSRAFVTATVAPPFPGGNVRVQEISFSGHNVLTKLNSRSQATVRLDTTRRDATAQVVVTPGARTGFLTEPTQAPFQIT